MSTSNYPIHRRILGILKRPLPDNLNALQSAFYRLKGAIYYRNCFGSFGLGSVLYKPMMLSNPRFMHIGKNVLIRQGVRLEAVVSDPGNPPELRIGDNVNIEQNVHIVCHSRIVIGDNVSITGNCAIVDVTHPYRDIHDPLKIGNRISTERSFVEIGDGSFLGFNVAVLPNVRIGNYCIIGAYSLVTRDVPDYSVVVGNPARIRRRYDPAKNEWILQ
jgi:acetyltransferase-like isoleucine patch superfamily enzyme